MLRCVYFSHALLYLFLPSCDASGTRCRAMLFKVSERKMKFIVILIWMSSLRYIHNNLCILKQEILSFGEHLYF